MVNLLSATSLALALSLAPPARVEPRPCTPAEAEAAERAAGGAHRSWAELHAQYAKFARDAACDDGAIAEGWSDAVARLLAGRWGELEALAQFAEADPGFLTFVLGHLDASAAWGDLKRASESANTLCPPRHALLCQQLGEASREALRTPRGALDDARAAAAQDAPLAPDGVRRLLASRSPGVAWRDPLQLDLDGDGHVDFAALGTSSSEALVGVILGAAAEAPAIFRFMRDATSQGGLCGAPARTELSVESLVGTGDDDAPVSARGLANSRKSGVRLDDGECDAFHFYFDGKTVRWWRR